MAEQYTPTVEEMRSFYVAERLDGPHLAGFPKPTVSQAEAEFDRGLAAHDAQVLRDAADEFEEYWTSGAPVSVGPEVWLRTLAARIEGGASA